MKYQIKNTNNFDLKSLYYLYKGWSFYPKNGSSGKNLVKPDKTVKNKKEKKKKRKNYMLTSKMGKNMII